MNTLLLYETAIGFAMFKTISTNTIDNPYDIFRISNQDFEHFSQIVKLISFKPFLSAQIALENINAVCLKTRITHELKSFIEVNINQIKRNMKTHFQLGILDKHLGLEIKNELNISCICTNITNEIFRGIRNHFHRFIREPSKTDIYRAQLGLAHAFSRTKAKFNPKKDDNMVIQAIYLIEILDKNIKKFITKIREWYGWCFPELDRIINTDDQYIKVMLQLKNKNKISKGLISSITKIVNNEENVKEIISSLRTSLGYSIASLDMMNIENFANQIIQMMDYKYTLHSYLRTKMSTIAPNLTALVGEKLGARLIFYSGSLINLAKYSSSTIQILGAEKALFRARKTKKNTPRYGIIYNSPFISKVENRKKGRMSRILASKCSIASRVDAFMDDYSTDAFGKRLKEQVEARILFYNEGLQ